MVRISGLARDVFSLYRMCLREVSKKPADSQEAFLRHVQSEFRKYAHEVPKKDFATIELLLRRGQRRMEVYSDPGVKRFTGAG